jgi:hypothetical protein
MRPGTQLIGSFAILLLIQAVTSLVALALLGRMSPAIERIMEENVASAEAVEQMALILAEPVLDDESVQRYREALDRARNNVTEPEERPLLDELHDLSGLALSEDPEVRRRSLEALEKLGSVNRAAMARSRDEAKRLGTAGAWAVTLLAFLGLGASFLAVTRSRRRILAPLAEISRVVAAHRAGETRQRYVDPAGNGHEIGHLGATLNDLLDHYERTEASPDVGPVERSVLLSLLDERARPVAVVDQHGELLAVNRDAEKLLASKAGPKLRAALRDVGRPDEDKPSGVVSAERIGDMGAVLCVLEDIQ